MLIQCYLLTEETINLLLSSDTIYPQLKTYTVNHFLPWQLMVEELLMRPQHKGIDYPMSENRNTVFLLLLIQLGIKSTNLKRKKRKGYITMLSKSVKGISSREHEPFESSKMPRYDFPFCLHSGKTVTKQKHNFSIANLTWNIKEI